MKIWDFLHKTAFQPFVRHRLQIRSFDEVKIFKYTYCTNKGRSRIDAKSKMERFVLIINGWKPLTIVKKISA